MVARRVLQKLGIDFAGDDKSIEYLSVSDLIDSIKSNKILESCEIYNIFTFSNHKACVLDETEFNVDCLVLGEIKEDSIFMGNLLVVVGKFQFVVGIVIIENVIPVFVFGNEVESYHVFCVVELDVA